MNFIVRMRNLLNCSQREFANFLGVSRFALAKVESDTGILPVGTNKYVMLMSDSIDLADQKNKNTVDSSIPNEILRNFFEGRNQTIAMALIKYRADLEVMDDKFENARLAKLYYESAYTNSGELDIRRKNWLTAQVEIQKSNMEKNDDLARHAMRVKIAQLELELTMNQQIVA